MKARAKTRPDRLLAAAMRQGDRMADQIADCRLMILVYIRTIQAAALLLEHGRPDSARRVLETTLNLEKRRGARR